jgi:hypothetical protein
MNPSLGTVDECHDEAKRVEQIGDGDNIDSGGNIDSDDNIGHKARNLKTQTKNLMRKKGACKLATYW